MDKRNFNSESFEAYPGFDESTREALDEYSEFEGLGEFFVPAAESEWENESRLVSPLGQKSRTGFVRPGLFAAGPRQMGLPRTPVTPAPWPDRSRPRGIVRARPRILSVDEPLSGPAHDSEFIRWMQSTLNQLLGLRIPVDGVMNAAARSALRRFQGRQGLPVDGFAGPETRKALIEARRKQSAESGEPKADEGAFEHLEPSELEWETEINRSSRDYAIWVQSSLNRIMSLQLAVDGMIGTQTRSAIRNFQQQKGLVPDGVIGSMTEAALIAAGAVKPPGAGSTSYTPTSPSIQPSPGQPSISPSFITIRNGVKLTTQIESVLLELDGYFRNANLKVTLTSGYRSPEDQLRIIREQAVKRGINRRYPAITTATVDNTESWLGAWDELLQREKFVVNPPKYACSRIIPGKCYSPSPHSTGLAFDLSGADLDQIANVVRDYCQKGGSLKQILVERTNGAVHVGIGTGGACRIEQR